VFASFCICSSQDVKRIGLRKWGCNTSKEDIKRSKEVQDSRSKEAQKNQRRNPRKGQSASAWWRTGQWTETARCALDCLVGQPDNLRRGPADGHSLSAAPDCLMCTRQSGNGQIQRSTATGSNGRLTWQAPNSEQCPIRCAPDCLVCLSTESCCFCPMTRNGVQAYKYHPN
jgi:hypothetical protein